MNLIIEWLTKKREKKSKEKSKREEPKKKTEKKKYIRLDICSVVIVSILECFFGTPCLD